MPAGPKSESRGKGARTPPPGVAGHALNDSEPDDAANDAAGGKFLRAEISTDSTSSPRSSIGLLAVLALIIVVSFYVFEIEIALISSSLGGAMLAIAVFDMRHYVIPDVLSLPLIPAGLVATYWLADEGGSLVVLIHLAAAVFGIGIFLAIRLTYQALRQREGLGLGDAKLAAVAGAWTGIGGLTQVMLLACIFALLAVLVANLRDLRSVKGSLAIPFGASLAPAIWFVWCSQMLGSVDLLP